MSDKPFDTLSIAKVAASQLPAGLWTALRGDPNAQTALGRYIPGGVQGLVGGVGQYGIDLANIAANKAPAALGYTGLPHIDTPEFIQQAQQHHEGAARAADADMPEFLQPVEPQNAPERVARDVTRGMAEVGFMPPISVGMRFMPSAVRAAADLVAPAALHPLAVGLPVGALTGAASIHNEVTNPQAGKPEFALPPDDTQTQAVSAPTTPGVQKPAFALPPEPTSGVAKPEFALPPDPDATGATSPQLQGRDDTKFTFGDVLTGVASLPLALLARRPIMSAWRGVTEAKRQAEYAAQREAVGLTTDDAAFPKPPGYDPANAPQVPQVQLPGDTGMATALNTKFVNADARVQQTLSAYAETPEDALFVRRAYGLVNDRLSAQNRSREFIETGIDPLVKTQLPAIGRYARRYAALDPEMQAKIDTTAKRRDELNDRDELMRRAISGGTTPHIDDPSLRYTLWSEPTTDMRATVARNMTDPVVKQFIDEYDAMNPRYVQHAVDRGLISQDTANNMINKHPNHISRVDPTGRLVDLFGPRELVTRGGPNVRTDNFVQTMMDQIPQIIRSSDINMTNQLIVETLLQGQARGGKPTIVTEIPERSATGGPLNDKQRRILNVGYTSGERSFEFHDPVMFDHITKHNDFLGLGLQAAAHATQVLQSGTTGALSLLSGRLFGLTTNLPRNILAGSTQRPAGMAGGLTDKALQTISGGKLGLRVADPLSVAGSAYELAAGSAAMLTKGIANHIERAQSPAAKFIRAFLGEQGTRNMIDGMNNAYARSNLSQARSESAAGAGQGSRSRVEALSNAPPKSFSSLKLAAEGLKRPYNPAFTNVPELYHGNGMSFAVRTKAMLNDFNNLMNDAYHLHVRRINPQMSLVERAYEVNQLTGAPGRTGESTGFRGYSTLVPYLNPSIQGVARAAQSYAQAPLGTFFGKVLTYSMFGYATRWLAMQGGQAHIDVLDNVITPREQVGTFNFMTNPNDPMDYAKIPTPQEDWGLIAIINEGAKHMIGFGDAVHDGHALEWLNNMFHTYVSARTAESIGYGLAQVVDPILQAPTVVNMALNAAGMRYRPDMTSVVQGLQHGKSPFGANSTVVNKINDPYALPGQTLSGGGDNAIMDAAASSLMGTIYGTGSAIMNEANHATSLGDFVHRLGDVYNQRFRQLNSIGGGIVWSAANQLRGRGAPEQQAVRNTMDALKPTEGLLQGEGNVGLTRKGGEPIEIRGEAQLSPDPIMRELLMQANALRTHLTGDFQRKINDMDKQRQAATTQDMPQDAKRETLNDLALKMQGQYIIGQQLIDKANEQATRLIGAPVDFAMPIDWKQGAMQFHQGSPRPEFGLPP